MEEKIKKRIKQLKTVETQVLLQLSSIRGGIAELELLLKEKEENKDEKQPKNVDLGD